MHASHQPLDQPRHRYKRPQIFTFILGLWYNAIVAKIKCFWCRTSGHIYTWKQYKHGCWIFGYNPPQIPPFEILCGTVDVTSRQQTWTMNESSPNECDLTKHLVHVWSWWWETTLQILSNYCHTTLYIINCTNNFTTYYNIVTSELTLSLSLEIILIILFVLILRVSGFLSWMVSWNISDHLYDYISELLSRYQVGKQATDKYTTYV